MIGFNVIEEFYKKLHNDKFGRYRSWEHCYEVFSFARTQKCKIEDYDYLSLHLAFYLSSWGMYRGSSFLIRKDYRIHTDAVKEILNKKYDPLFGINCSELKLEQNLLLLMELSNFLSDYYSTVRNSLRKTKNDRSISETLITKILLGTLGCVPAYDRYFKSGIRNKKVASSNFSRNSIILIADFYINNELILENIRCKFKIGNLIYPQMKIIDMLFWQIGLELDKDNSKK